MNSLEIRLAKINPSLFSKFQDSKEEITLLLNKYSSNFPTYTDHSSKHTLEVFQISSDILSNEEVERLNADEIYILSMASLLHDVGMCLPEDRIKELIDSDEFTKYRQSHPNLSTEEYIRDIHHQLSHKFIIHEWISLKIPSIKYAKAIGLVAEGHRKVELGNFEIYDPQFFAKSGKEFVCLPYLACILRIADELDVTNSRTPRLLTKYYMPQNEESIREWNKHIATSQRNYLNNKVIFEVDCSNQSIYAALQDQFDKIQNVINYCQKVIRSIPHINQYSYSLGLSAVDVRYSFLGFHPKGIKFSFDVQNVVTAFIGEDLYKDKLSSLREAMQNAIDSCRYKSTVINPGYQPSISIRATMDYIEIEDNGAGMDEFIIENYFGRLASSFYQQEKVKSQYEAIGQFGVGVFSYFLISEYIDIETKALNSPSVKFRFDKDPKSYFHFYDKSDRKSPGTTITMYLKDEIKSKYTIEIFEEYIKKIFKHIEIPIWFQHEGSNNLISKQIYALNPQKEIKERLKLTERKMEDKISYVEVSIDEEDVEGFCMLILGKNYVESFDFVNYFDSDQFRALDHPHHLSQIAISQKGVFVNNYNSSSIGMVIGNLNLKKKIKINIDRNEFTNSDHIYKVIQKFEFQLLYKTFKYLKERAKNELELLKISNSFLNNYLLYSRSNFSPDLTTLIVEFLHFKILLNGQTCIKSFKEILTSFTEMVIVSDKHNFIEISKNTKKNVLIANESEFTGIVSDLESLLIYLCGCGDYFLSDNGKYYRVYNWALEDEEYDESILKLKNGLGFHFLDISKFEASKLAINIWKNKGESEMYYYVDEEIFINFNHYFIQFILSNFDEIKNSSNYRKIVKSVFSYIYENYSKIISGDFIRKLNEIVYPLNSISKLKKFKNSDFDF